MQNWKKMIDLSDLDAERTAELPAKPLKEWRDKFESNAITANDFIQYFQKASPFFLTFEKPKDYLDLGETQFFILFIENFDSISNFVWIILCRSKQFQRSRRKECNHRCY